MTATLEAIELEAMKLSVSERAVLAEHLLASLDTDSEIEAAWAAEIAARIEEIDQGKAELLPLADVLTELRNSSR